VNVNDNINNNDNDNDSGYESWMEGHWCGLITPSTSGDSVKLPTRKTDAVTENETSVGKRNNDEEDDNTLKIYMNLPKSKMMGGGIDKTIQDETVLYYLVNTTVIPPTNTLVERSESNLNQTKLSQ